jgi:chromosome segregation ATPase
VTYATVETVRDAVAALHDQGVQPSIPKIRQRLGGGSHTTILRCLREIRDENSSEVQSEDTSGADASSLPEKIRQRIADLGTGLLHLEEAIRASLEKEIAEEHRRLREAHTAEINRLNQTIDDVRTRTEGATRDTHEVCEELDRAHSDLEHARDEIERLGNERDELKTSSDQLREALRELQAERDKIVAERDAARDTAETARAAADRAEGELSRVLAERQTAIAERDRATEALDEARQELRETHGRLATADARVAAQDSALAACREAQDQHRQESADLQTSLRQAEVARGSAEGQLAALQSAYTAEREAWRQERDELLSRLSPPRRTSPRKASGSKTNT